MRNLLILAGVCAAASTAVAQTLLNSQLYSSNVVSGLVSPTSFEFLSGSTILVTEKTTGKVKVVTNGIITGDALDLTVPTNGEMGLLGIVKDPNFASNNFIYIFHSRADSDGGPWLDDRLVRYTWNGSTLVSPTPLWIIGPTAQYPNEEVSHHGGYMRIGPDNKLYIQRGDMLRWGSLEMNNNINVIANSGCIYRLNLDGSAPSDNPFFSHPNENIKRAWVYGFRNGFGMTFDRTTNDLWFSENGPEVYDEINIAVPGMNSGWRLIMGPDAREAVYVNNGMTPSNAKDLIYLPGATYHDPVFSYLTPIGVAAFEFFSSTRYLESSTVFDNAILGCTNTGSFYIIPILPNRSGVNATGALADLVADTTAERNVWQAGNGWGALTDAKIGPDGYMYVCSWNLGRLIKIMPKADAVFPNDVQRIRGVQTSGNLDSSLEYSDDDKLQLRPGPVFSTSQSPVVLECTGISPFQSPSALNFVVEASASSGSIDMTVEFWNYNTGEFDLADSIDLTGTDVKYTVSAPGPIANYVQPGTKEMRARVSTKAGGPVLSYPWTGRFDMLHWTSTTP